METFGSGDKLEEAVTGVVSVLRLHLSVFLLPGCRQPLPHTDGHGCLHHLGLNALDPAGSVG